MHERVTWLVLAVVLAGCAGSAPLVTGPNAAPVERLVQPPGEAPPVHHWKIHREGVILYRTPGREIAYEGQTPFFHLRLTNATRVMAQGAWGPPQDAGVELQDAQKHQYASWTGAADLHLTEGSVTLDRPTNGSWYVMIGPTVVGADMTWTLDLDVEGAVEPALVEG